MINTTVSAAIKSGIVLIDAIVPIVCPSLDFDQ
jgi:hypothetical protein